MKYIDLFFILSSTSLAAGALRSCGSLSAGIKTVLFSPFSSRIRTFANFAGGPEGPLGAFRITGAATLTVETP